MDISTIGGLIACFGVVLLGILFGGNPIALFLDPASFFIVIGGSFAAMMVASPIDRITGGFIRILRKATNNQLIDYGIIITQIVGFSETARKEGLLSLDDAVNDIDDDFFRNGMRMVVDGTDPEIVKSLLFAQIGKIESRHEIGASFYGRWSAIAPAFGLIGTLIGLIGMMANLDDVSSVGPNMAVALVTTLYGSILANMFLIPVQAKLEERNQDEVLKLEIITEGILSLQGGENPKILEQKLYTFLAPSARPANLGD